MYSAITSCDERAITSRAFKWAHIVDFTTGLKNLIKLPTKAMEQISGLRTKENLTAQLFLPDSTRTVTPNRPTAVS